LRRAVWRGVGLRGVAWGCVGLRGSCVGLRGDAWDCVGLRQAVWSVTRCGAVCSCASLRDMAIGERSEEGERGE
jgi:hypothetical protein